MTFQLGPQQVLVSAGRLVKEGGAHAVKLEGRSGRRSDRGGDERGHSGDGRMWG